MTSSQWIDHFYKNACAMTRAVTPSGFGPEDLNSLRAVRPGRISLRSGKLLIENSAVAARRSRDLSFTWAVRLYVQEQQRRHQLLHGLVADDLRLTTRDDWRGAIIDSLPAHVVVLLLGCRARVGAKFFAALAQRASCQHMRDFYERLEREELGQSEFSSFAGAQLAPTSSHWSAPVIKVASNVITIGIASRVWLRQRARLRESGQTFTAFLSGLLEPARS